MKELITIEEFKSNVVEWAKNRSLIPGDPEKQYLKFLEEIGETSRAILKDDKKEIKDGFGDIAVTLVILAEQLDRDMHLFLSPKDSKIEFMHFKRLVSLVTIDAMENLIFELNYECNALGYNLLECMNLAWDEIKDRTGKTVNGTFIKNQ